MIHHKLWNPRLQCQTMESRGILYFGFRDMFALINKKGMEVVMHFLFSRLNSHLAYEEFRY